MPRDLKAGVLSAEEVLEETTNHGTSNNRKLTTDAASGPLFGRVCLQRGYDWVVHDTSVAILGLHRLFDGQNTAVSRSPKDSSRWTK
jgi:hypothetical protein